MDIEALIETIANALGVSPVSLLLALGLSAIVVGVIGKIAKDLGVWSGKIDARRQPQQSFTTKTPDQVVKESKAARWERLLYLFVLIASTLLCVGPFLLRKWGLLDETLKLMRLILQGVLGSP